MKSLQALQCDVNVTRWWGIVFLADDECRVTLYPSWQKEWSDPLFPSQVGTWGLLQLQLYQNFLSLTFPKLQATPSLSFLYFCPSDQADLAQLETPHSHPFPGRSLIPCKRAAPVEPFTPLLIAPLHPPHIHPHVHATSHAMRLATAKQTRKKVMSECSWLSVPPDLAWPGLLKSKLNV